MAEQFIQKAGGEKVSLASQGFKTLQDAANQGFAGVAGPAVAPPIAPVGEVAPVAPVAPEVVNKAGLLGNVQSTFDKFGAGAGANEAAIRGMAKLAGRQPTADELAQGGTLGQVAERFGVSDQLKGFGMEKPVEAVAEAKPLVPTAPVTKPEEEKTLIEKIRDLRTTQGAITPTGEAVTAARGRFATAGKQVIDLENNVKTFIETSSEDIKSQVEALEGQGRGVVSGLISAQQSGLFNELSDDQQTELKAMKQDLIVAQQKALFEQGLLVDAENFAKETATTLRQDIDKQIDDLLLGREITEADAANLRKETEREEKLALNGMVKLTADQLGNFTESQIMRVPNPFTGAVDIYKVPEEAAGLDTQIIKGAGGSSLLVNTQTGDVIKDFGSATRVTSGGSGSTSGDITSLSALAKQVFANPAILNNLTATEKGKILKEIANTGADISRFGIKDVSASSRDKIAKFDDMQRAGEEATLLLDDVKDIVGPFASKVQEGKAVFGSADPDFIRYKSALTNLGSVLLNLRSGAAVSEQEYARLKGFIPLVTDPEVTATEKIANFVREMDLSKNNYIKRSTQSAFDIQQSAAEIEQAQASEAAGPDLSGINFKIN